MFFTKTGDIYRLKITVKDLGNSKRFSETFDGFTEYVYKLSEVSANLKLDV